MRSAGLRVQIVVAVCGLMTLAFVPLFFAVASLTRVALHGAQVDRARALGHATAAHAAALDAPDAHALAAIIASTDVTSLCVLDGDVPRTCAGEPTGAIHGTIEERIVSRHGVVVARVRVDESTDRAAPLVRLFGVYMTAFALALAFFVYVALTRLIVKPVEALAAATDRVANGARKLDAPVAGARELVELSHSVSTMTARLIADEATLRRKVEELEGAQAQIVRSERLASVGRLAAGMAHEIGNPITAIIGMQELMLAGDVTVEESADYVKRMRKETERVHGILRDLLDFARPEADAGTVATGPAVVHDVMNDVVALVKPQKNFRDVTVAVECEDVIARIAPERLTQVLLNLALNAADALANAERDDKRITLRAATLDAKTIRLEVEDSGPGVAPGVCEKLFLPFVTTKEVGQGTGLGLAVCRGLVEAVGGRIDLDVEYKSGARFVITLPKISAAPE